MDKCDHTVGLYLGQTQWGEGDSLVTESDKIEPDDVFEYCPRCGNKIALDVSNRHALKR